MVMKSFQKCRKAYVFSILAACLFLVVSLAFSAEQYLCYHCGNHTACDFGDDTTQQGWENCLWGYYPGTQNEWCDVWGDFGDCDPE